MSKATLSNEQLSQILQRLSTDDAFREALLGDPVGTLKQYGVEVDPASVPHARSLLPKNATASQLDALKTKIEGKAGLALFLLTK